MKKPKLPRRLAALRDPGIQAALVLLATALGGFVLLGMAWRGAARTVYVPLQMPWLISSGLGGLALLGAALGSWHIHVGRRIDAEHRAVVDDLTRHAAQLADDLRAGRVRRRARS
jgi:hypothetical protein